MEKIASSKNRALRKIKGVHSKSEYYFIYEQIRLENNPQKIIEIIDNSNVNKEILRINCFDFVIANYPRQKDTLISEMKEKIDYYFKYINKDKIKMREEQIKTITDYVLEFLNFPNITVTEYCAFKNIEVCQFQHLLQILKKENIELYNKYRQKIEYQIKLKFRGIIKSTQTIVDEIKNGVLENGVKRSFRIEYYYLVTKIRPIDM